MLKLDTVTTQPFENKKQTKSRAFFFLANETVLDDLINRHSRPYNEYRRLLVDYLTEQEVKLDLVTIKWSQKAGCACGCSPGFIVDGWLGPKLHKRDLYLDVSKA